MALFRNKNKYYISIALFVITLVLAHTLTLFSTEAHAANTSSIAEGDLIEIGNKDVNGYTGTPLWRVIEKESNGSMLLISEYLWRGNGKDSTIGVRFNDNQTKNRNGQVFHWRGTDAETWCMGFEESILNGIPELNIVPATKSDEEYLYTQTLYAEGNNKEILFAAADTILYQNGVYFLSAEEVATYIPNPADRKSNIPGKTVCEQWLLRSTQNGTEWAAEIKPDGEIAAVTANTRRAVRPAFRAKFADGTSFVSITNENDQKVWTVGDEQEEAAGGNQKPEDNKSKGIKSSEDKSKSIKTVRINAKTVNAKSIKAAILAAGGKPKYVTQIVIGKNVKKISKKSFKGTNIKTIVVKSKKLKKKTVKGSLKESKVKTVKVKVGNKKLNKEYVKKYKRIFTKKNAGKKVKVKR